MKIALISSPFVEVPPLKYGGTERIVQYLAKKLLELDQTVTLYAPGESTTDTPLRPICDLALFNDPTYNHATDRLRRVNQINIRTLDLLDRDTDIINIHDYDNSDLIDRISRLGIPVVVSIGHAITPVIREIYERFRSNSNIHFHGLSSNQLQPLDPNLPFIHNGIDKEIYQGEEVSKRSRFFFSIGDMKPIKAHKTAIQLARKSSLDLVIAGAPYYPESLPYFQLNVLPEIDLDVSNQKQQFLEDLKTGRFTFGSGRVIYFGSATDNEKVVLYRYATFMQFLGNLEVSGNLEACPLTILESILSGTSVLGVKGSVTTELVDDGKTGYNVNSIAEAKEILKKIGSLDSMSIRAEGVRRFSSDRMARDYLNFYKNYKISPPFNIKTSQEGWYQLKTGTW